MDLPDGEAVLDEALDLVVVGDDECPGQPMAVTAVRADPLETRAISSSVSWLSPPERSSPASSAAAT